MLAVSCTQDHERIDDVVGRNREKSTIFEAQMEANKFYNEGRDLTYVEFPTSFVYN